MAGSTFKWSGGVSDDAGNPSNWLMLVSGTFVTSEILPGVGASVTIDNGGFVNDGGGDWAIGGQTIDFLGSGGTLQDGVSDTANDTTIAVAAGVTATVQAGNISSSATLIASGAGAVLNAVGLGTYDMQGVVLAFGGATVNLQAIRPSPTQTFGPALQIGGALANEGGTLNVVASTSLLPALGVLVPVSGALTVATLLPYSDAVVFDGTLGSITLDTTQNQNLRIFGFQTGDTVDLPAMSYFNDFSYDLSGGTLFVSSGNLLAYLDFSASGLTAGDFHITSDSGGGVAITAVGVTNPSWIGGAGDWSAATNWSTGIVPGASADVLIEQTTATPATPFTVTATNQAAGSVVLLEPQDTLQLSGSFAVARSISSGSGTVALAPGANVTAAFFGELTTGGVLAMDPGSTLTLGGGTSIDDNGIAALAADGFTTLDGATLNAAAGGVLVGWQNSAGASMVASGGAQVTAEYTALGFNDTGSGAGTLVLDGADWSDVGSPGSSPLAGDMLVGAGELGSDGGFLGGKGALVLTDGATLSDAAADIAPSYIGTGDVQVMGGSLWRIAGNLTVGGNFQSVAALQVTTGGSLGTPGTLMVGGTLAADGMVQFSGGAVGQVGALTLTGGSLFVDGASTLNVGGAGGTAAGGGLIVEAGSTAVVGSDIPFINSGTATLDGVVNVLGALQLNAINTIEGTLIGAGTLQLSGTADIQADLAPTPSTNVAFAGGSELILAGSGEIGHLYDFVPKNTLSNTVDLPGLTYDPAATIEYDGSTGVLTISGDAFAAETFTLDPGYAPSQLLLRPDGGTGTEIVGQGPACYAAGTRLATPAGEAPVEALGPGDFVLALQDGAWQPRPVRWVGRVSIDLARHAWPAQAAPIRIAAHAVAAGVPRRDLLVSPDHAICLAGALFQAQALVNGATIAREFPPRVTYVHVELDRHAVLLAEGLPAESYLDTGNRALFAGEAGKRPLHPDLAALRVWAEHGCAPLHLQGAALTATHARLLQRAEALGHRLTEEPDLHVLADGREALLLRAGPRAWQAMLPARTRAVRLCSRSFVPAWFAGAVADARRLGVAVASLRLGARRLPDAHHGGGWHAPEPRWRWTTGEAELTLRPSSRPRVLAIAAAPAGARYWAQARPAVRGQTRAA